MQKKIGRILKINEHARKFYEIFCPGDLEKLEAVENEKQKFVYYTSAETAFKVLRNEQLWLRNVSVMNDFSEVQYGLGLIARCMLGGQADKSFKEAVDFVFPGTTNVLAFMLAEGQAFWARDTYIACVSKHLPRENDQGRLSMWRAYGNTALVVNNTPIVASTDRLGVFSLPVLYKDMDGFRKLTSEIAEAISGNVEYLRSMGGKYYVDAMRMMLLRFAIGVKHPGFAEEEEWRLYISPLNKTNPIVEAETLVLQGVAQKVFKLPLKHDPENGLFGADIPSLLDRVIVGPTQYHHASRMAFVDVLKEAGVEDAESKVVVSAIPLRR